MALKIYTKTGDAGQTGLFGGARLSKHDLRIEAYGTVDELNAWVGVLRDGLSAGTMQDQLTQVQSDLFTIGTMLALEPGKSFEGMPELKSSRIIDLEVAIDLMEQQLPPLKNFILPAGHPLVSQCHVVRTVCRRAERRVVALHEAEPVDEIILQFLNRLSDYLFVLARAIGQQLGVEEVVWKP